MKTGIEGTRGDLKGNGTGVPMERSTVAATVIKIGNEEQIHVHFCYINLNTPFLVTQAPEMAGSEMCLHGDLSIAHP